MIKLRFYLIAFLILMKGYSVYSCVPPKDTDGAHNIKNSAHHENTKEITAETFKEIAKNPLTWLAVLPADLRNEIWQYISFKQKITHLHDTIQIYGNQSWPRWPGDERY